MFKQPPIILTIYSSYKYLKKLKYIVNKYAYRELYKNKYEVVPMNIQRPWLYVVPKVNKDHVTLRSIVSFLSALPTNSPQFWTRINLTLSFEHTHIR